MDTYFNKAVVFTDSHFGRSSDSPIANQDNLEFIDWMIDRARAWDAETCLFLGDYFHNRSSIGVQSLDQASIGLQKIANAGFKHIVFLTGNHDIARRESRDVSSLNVLRHMDNIQLINHPVTINDVTLLPWLVADDRAMLSSIKSRYVFGHLETVGAMMNARIVCTGSKHAIEADTFVDGPEYVFSGHFHARQTIQASRAAASIVYIGSTMCHDFNDAHDSARGLMLLQSGRDPIFESWPDQPLYHISTLSGLLDNLNVLRPKMTVRTTLDIDMHHEEAQEMRQMLIEQYSLRKLELTHAASTEALQVDIDSDLHTVDQIVADGLRGIDSVGISADHLVDIFMGLPRL